MNLKNKNVLYFAFVLVAVFLLLGLFCFLFSNKENYNIKISITIPNKNAKFIDEFYSKNITNELLEINQIKDILCVSSSENLNIYLKTALFQKEKAIQKADRKIDFVISKMAKIPKGDENLNENAVIVEFDENYDLNYDTFISLNFAQNTNISKMKKFTNNVFEELLKMKFSKQIKTFNNQKRAVYLYFDYPTLEKFKIQISDIKAKIKDYNLEKNFTKEFTKEDMYHIELKNEIKDIEDIKSAKLSYLDKNFMENFENIFEIKEEIKKPIPYKIKQENFESVVFALKKKNFYPNILFNLELKNFLKKYNETSPDYLSLSEFKTNNFKKITLFLSPYSSIEKLEKTQKEIEEKLKEKNIKNTLFFLGIDNPKISKNDIFQEISNNKIIILCQKRNYKKTLKILKDNNFSNISLDKKSNFKFIKDSDFLALEEKIEEQKENSEIELTKNKNEIIYYFDNSYLNRFQISKKEATEALLCQKSGLKIDEFKKDQETYDIILKNKDNLENIFAYSKKYNSLVSLESGLEEKLKSEYYSIARKNGDFVALASEIL